LDYRDPNKPEINIKEVSDENSSFDESKSHEASEDGEQVTRISM
jgi:CRP-like cAMP-binding protein